VSYTRDMGILSVQPRYSQEEFARRGDEIYEREVAPRVGPDDKGKFVVIDIETGDFEVDRDELAAADRVRDRNPDAQLWFRKVGFSYAYRFGGLRLESLRPVPDDRNGQ
jgi:hypothetical protein